MTRELVLEGPPDLRRIYATAALKRAAGHDGLPDLRVVRRGVTVDPDNLARYARACQFTLSERLPLPYPHLLGFPLQMVVMSQHDFPFPLVGSIHVENVITVSKPLTLADPLDVAVHAENLRLHPKGRQVDLVTEVSSGDQTAWRGVSTYLARGAEHPEAVASEPPTLDALESVRSGPTWRFGERTGRMFAGIGGDWNPIHVHPILAKPLGFPTAIAHGMYSYSRCVAALQPRLPQSGVTSHVWFRKPIRLPSTVRLRTAFEHHRMLSLLEGVKRDLDHAVLEHTW
ncbi:dehydratase [Intrasporangium chromatireducens Q5-1]|uniref:Dehydratase n=2 Tax=Intrasporangium TaxID=53357 RepID=W9GL85_9MICO|nr:dehydratase [Intrasporangium chromatireducens Q5-1]